MDTPTTAPVAFGIKKAGGGMARFKKAANITKVDSTSSSGLVR
jgi:hypothetical protein